MKPRRTRQMTAIETVLREASDHPTAAQIHVRVARSLPQMSLATVYRNLEKLVQSGLAVPVRFDGEVTRYDGMTEAHDHFVCRRCGHVTDLIDGAGPAVDVTPLERAGYDVAAHALALFGICPACA